MQAAEGAVASYAGASRHEVDKRASAAAPVASAGHNGSSARDVHAIDVMSQRQHESVVAIHDLLRLTHFVLQSNGSFEGEAESRTLKNDMQEKVIGSLHEARKLLDELSRSFSVESTNVYGAPSATHSTNAFLIANAPYRDYLLHLETCVFKPLRESLQVCMDGLGGRLSEKRAQDLACRIEKTQAFWELVPVVVSQENDKIAPLRVSLNTMMDDIHNERILSMDPGKRIWYSCLMDPVEDQIESAKSLSKAGRQSLNRLQRAVNSVVACAKNVVTTWAQDTIVERAKDAVGAKALEESKKKVQFLPLPQYRQDSVVKKFKDIVTQLETLSRAGSDLSEEEQKVLRENMMFLSNANNSSELSNCSNNWLLICKRIKATLVLLNRDLILHEASDKRIDSDLNGVEWAEHRRLLKEFRNRPKLDMDALTKGPHQAVAGLGKNIRRVLPEPHRSPVVTPSSLPVEHVQSLPVLPEEGEGEVATGYVDYAASMFPPLQELQTRAERAMSSAQAAFGEAQGKIRAAVRTAHEFLEPLAPCMLFPSKPLKGEAPTYHEGKNIVIEQFFEKLESALMASFQLRENDEVSHMKMRTMLACMSAFKENLYKSGVDRSVSNTACLNNLWHNYISSKRTNYLKKINETFAERERSDKSLRDKFSWWRTGDKWWVSMCAFFGVTTPWTDAWSDDVDNLQDKIESANRQIKYYALLLSIFDALPRLDAAKSPASGSSSSPFWNDWFVVQKLYPGPQPQTYQSMNREPQGYTCWYPKNASGVPFDVIKKPRTAGELLAALKKKPQVTNILSAAFNNC